MIGLFQQQPLGWIHPEEASLRASGSGTPLRFGLKVGPFQDPTDIGNWHIGGSFSISSNRNTVTLTSYNPSVHYSGLTGNAGKAVISIPLTGSPGSLNLQGFNAGGSLGAVSMYGDAYPVRLNLGMGNATFTSDGHASLQNVSVNGMPMDVRWDRRGFTVGPLSGNFGSNGRLSSVDVNLQMLPGLVGSVLGTSKLDLGPHGTLDLQSVNDFVRDNRLGSIHLTMQDLERLRSGDTSVITSKFSGKINASRSATSGINQFIGLLQMLPMSIDEFHEKFTVIVRRTALESVAYGVAWRPNRNFVLLLEHTDAQHTFNVNVLPDLGATLPTNVSYTTLGTIFNLGAGFSANVRVGAAFITPSPVTVVDIGGSTTSSLYFQTGRRSKPVIMPTGEIGLDYTLKLPNGSLTLGAGGVPVLAQGSDPLHGYFRVGVAQKFTATLKSGDTQFCGFMQLGSHGQGGSTFGFQLSQRF